MPRLKMQKKVNEDINLNKNNKNKGKKISSDKKPIKEVLIEEVLTEEVLIEEVLIGEESAERVEKCEDSFIDLTSDGASNDLSSDESFNESSDESSADSCEDLSLDSDNSSVGSDNSSDASSFADNSPDASSSADNSSSDDSSLYIKIERKKKSLNKKENLLFDIFSREEGSTIENAAYELNWKTHSVRGVLSKMQKDMRFVLINISSIKPDPFDMNKFIKQSRYFIRETPHSDKILKL